MKSLTFFILLINLTDFIFLFFVLKLNMSCDGATRPSGLCSLTSLSVKFDFCHCTNVSVLFLCALLPEYVALYTYESPQAGDLTFTDGDVILVSKREGEWWSGSTGDRTGLFPHNYVKPKEADVRTCTHTHIKQSFYI